MLPKAGGAVGGAVAILSVMHMLVRDREFLLIVCAGVGLIGLALLGWWMWGRFRNRQRGAAMAGRLSGSTPGTISTASQLARIDALRSVFEEAIDKFRKHGKNPYDTPWYLLVGERGAGKTEAIRHSKVRFIPGLQDPLQGVGGTINMNWWFTKDAVILDTAGRMMFDEIEPGSPSEWGTFLDLLRTYRRDCPVNGLLLMIPADTLMTDSAGQIEAKAARIAEQLENVRHSLGIRFPVFVIITKCDLISGFNEFFADLNQPREESQILGWSNPAPLDAEFSSRAVDQYMGSLRQRLLRRRLRLLLEPIEGAEPARRFDQMDSLYSLPDNLATILPRLKQYLETVFVGNLFLRGIYFTSSFQKGSPLDMDLAAALGIPVDKLPKDRERNQPRTLFLRDAFMEKVFPEKGLVTRVSNVRSLQTRKLWALVGGTAIAAALFLFFAWLGISDLRSKIGEHQALWADIDNAFKKDALAVDPERPDKDVRVASRGKHERPLTLLKSADELARKPIGVSPIFRPFAVVGEDLNTRRSKAHAKLVNATIVMPLLQLARTRLREQKPEDWDDRSTAALKELIAFHAGAGGQTTGGGLNIDPLYIYLAKSADDVSRSRADTAREIVEYVYGPDGLNIPWPAQLFQAKGMLASEAVTRGTEAYIAYCQRRQQIPENTEEILARLGRALRGFDNAEDSLCKAITGDAVTIEAYDKYCKAWEAGLKVFGPCAKELQDAAAALQPVGWDGKQPPMQAVTARIEPLKKELAALAAELDAALGRKGQAKNADLQTARDQVRDAVQKCDVTLARLTPGPDGQGGNVDVAEIGKLYKPYLLKVGGSTSTTGPAGTYLFLRHRDIFKLADERFSQTDPKVLGPTTEKDIAALFDGPGKSVAQLMAGTAARSQAATAMLTLLVEATADNGPQTARVEKAASRALDLARRYENHMLLDRVISRLKPTGESTTWSPPTRPAPMRPGIPLTATLQEQPLSSDYVPEAVKQVVRLRQDLQQQIKDAPLLDGGLQTAFDATGKQWGDYLQAYEKYWDRQDQLKVEFRDKTWISARAQLKATSASEIADSLRKLAQTMAGAYDAVPLTDKRDKMLAVAASLKDPAVPDMCGAMIDAWASLDADPIKARATLLSLNDQQFSRTFVLPPDCPAMLTAWCGQIPELCLERISAEVDAPLLADIKKLGDYQAKFPLNPKGAEDLDSGDVAAVEALMLKLTGGDGVQRRSKLVAERLLKNDLWRSSADWMESAKPMINILPKGQQKLAFGVRWEEPKPVIAGLPGGRNADELQIKQGGQVIGGAFLNGRPSDNDFREPLELPGGELLITLGTDNLKNVIATQKFGADPKQQHWSVLRMLQEGGTREADGSWRVKLTWKENTREFTMDLILKPRGANILPRDQWPEPPKPAKPPK